VRIADIRIGERHRKDMGDIEGLARSIDEIGLLHPVVVRPWTCQAYISEETQGKPVCLLACAVVRTRDLIGYAKAGLEHEDRAKVYTQTNRYDGNEFLVVNWHGLESAGLLPICAIPQTESPKSPEYV